MTTSRHKLLFSRAMTLYSLLFIVFQLNAQPGELSIGNSTENSAIVLDTSKGQQDFFTLSANGYWKLMSDFSETVGRSYIVYGLTLLQDGRVFVGTDKGLLVSKIESLEALEIVMSGTCQVFGDSSGAVIVKYKDDGRKVVYSVSNGSEITNEAITLKHSTIVAANIDDYGNIQLASFNQLDEIRSYRVYFKSFNSSKWKSVNAPLFETHSIYFDNSSKRGWLLSDTDSGVFETLDEGQSWTYIKTPERYINFITYKDNLGLICLGTSGNYYLMSEVIDTWELFDKKCFDSLLLDLPKKIQLKNKFVSTLLK